MERHPDRTPEQKTRALVAAAHAADFDGATREFGGAMKAAMPAAKFARWIASVTAISRAS